MLKLWVVDDDFSSLWGKTRFLHNHRINSVLCVHIYMEKEIIVCIAL